MWTVQTVQLSWSRFNCVYLLHSATNMAPAVSESCQPTFGDVMWCQNGRSSYCLPFRKRHLTLADITVRLAWHGKLRINARLRSTSQCDDHVRCHIDMVLPFYWVSSILSLIWLFLLYGQQLRNQAQIRLIVHFSCYIYFPVADMEAGLPEVTSEPVMTAAELGTTLNS